VHQAKSKILLACIDRRLWELRDFAHCKAPDPAIKTTIFMFCLNQDETFLSYTVRHRRFGILKHSI